MEPSKTYSQSVEALRQSIAAHRGASTTTQRFPLAMKRAALRLLGTGISAEDLAHELGLQPSLLYRWKRKGPRPKQVEVAPQATVAPRVLMVEPPDPQLPQATQAGDVASLRVVAGGFTITITRGDG